MSPGGMPAPVVPNYLVQAILCTLFCCLPAGIVSIVYAAQVNSKLSVGDRAGAIQSSENAKKWAWVSFGVSIGLILLYIVIVIVVAATRSTN